LVRRKESGIEITTTKTYAFGIVGRGLDQRLIEENIHNDISPVLVVGNNGGSF
jgi:hypothetical protein